MILKSCLRWNQLIESLVGKKQNKTARAGKQAGWQMGVSWVTNAAAQNQLKSQGT